jgi:hypothetical protein
MFAKFAIAATAAVLAAAIALPASAKPPVRDPGQNSSTMPDRTPAPPVSLPSRPTSGTMNIPPAPKPTSGTMNVPSAPKPTGTMNVPSQQPASGSASRLPVR